MLLKDLAKSSRRGLKRRGLGILSTWYQLLFSPGFASEGIPRLSSPSSRSELLPLVSDETPFYVFPLRVFIVMPALWKKQWRYVDEGIFSDLGNGYFDMRFSVGSHKPASKHETMVVFQR